MTFNKKIDNNPHLPNCNWLVILGCLGSISSFVFLLGSIVTVSKIDIFGSAICFLLSIIVWGIGSVIEAINANTRSREK